MYPQGLNNQPPAQATSMPTPSGINHPMVPMSPAMVSSIKSSPKGKIPAGLAKYLAAKKAAKGKVKSGK